MIVRLVSMLLLLCLTSIGISQEVRFGRVSTTELRETTDSVFGEIPAKIIYKRILLNYGKDIEIHERVKIYNKEGFKYSNWEIMYEDISHLQAYSYYLEDGVIQKTHVTKESIFKENVYGDYEITKITFPNVKEGSVIELKYKIDIGRWDVISIQKDIPIRNFRLVIQNVWSRMEFKQNPNFPIQLTEEVTDKKKLKIFTGRDIPALVNAPFVNNINNYRGKMYIKYGKEDEDERWGLLTNRFNRAYWFGTQLKTKPFFKKDLEKIQSKYEDSLALAKGIFAFVKNRMVYNDRYALGTYDMKEVYKTKNGDKGDINMLLTLMLRHAGLRANPMVIGCKHKGEVLFAEVSSFNALVTALQIGDEFYLLDASERYAKFGLIPTDLMNGYGLIVRDDGSSISYPTASAPHSVSRSVINAGLDVSSGTVSGDSKIQLTNYMAWEYREGSEAADGETFAENKESEHEMLTIENLTEKDVKDRNKPVVLSFDFTYLDAVEEINEELYVAPFLFFGKEENEFKEEVRLYPIDIEYPYIENFKINFEIPEGYEVVSIPESKKVTIENGVGSLLFISSITDTHIQLNLNVQLNYSIIPAEFYGALRSLYSEYVELTKSKIVLSKN